MSKSNSDGQNLQTDPDLGDKGGENTDGGDPNADNSETITLSKKDYDQLQHSVRKYSKSSRDYKRELENLRKQSTKPQPDDDDDFDDDLDDDREPNDKPTGKPDLKERFKQRMKRAEDRFTQTLAEKDKELETVRAEKADFIKNQLLNDLISRSDTTKKNVPHVTKLVRDEFELVEDGAGGYTLEPKGGDFYSAEKWLENWLEENDGFKENKRPAGHGEDGAASRGGASNGRRLPTAAELNAMKPAEKQKFLRENPELRARLADQTMNRGR